MPLMTQRETAARTRESNVAGEGSRKKSSKKQLLKLRGLSKESGARRRGRGLLKLSTVAQHVLFVGNRSRVVRSCSVTLSNKDMRL